MQPAAVWLVESLVLILIKEWILSEELEIIVAIPKRIATTNWT